MEENAERVVYAIVNSKLDIIELYHPIEDVAEDPKD